MAAASYDILVNESSLFQIGEDCYVTIYYHYWKDPHFNNGLWKWDELEVDSWELTGTGPMYDDISEFKCLDTSKVVNGWTTEDVIYDAVNETNALGHVAVIFCYPEYIKIPKGITTVANYFLLKHDEGNYHVIEKMLKHVEIGLGLEKIGSYAFCGQCDLEDVITENNDGTSVKYIGARAFSSCSNLKTLDLDARTVDDKECISLLEYIGASAFSECSNLIKINYNNVINCEIGRTSFKLCNSLTLITFGSKTKIAKSPNTSEAYIIGDSFSVSGTVYTTLVLDTDTYGRFDTEQFLAKYSYKGSFVHLWEVINRPLNPYLIFKHNDKVYKIYATYEKPDNFLYYYNSNGVDEFNTYYIKLSDTYKGIPIIFKKDDKIYYVESNN